MMNENLRTTPTAVNNGLHDVKSGNGANGAVEGKDPQQNQHEELSDTAVPATAKAEHGGPKGPEPTRYGDWERNGRCYDF